jgi:hypothetical protein
MLYLCSGNLGALFATRSQRNQQTFAVRPRNREFQFPDVARKFAVLFDPRWSPRRAKCCELCSMPCGAMPEQEPKLQNIPVKFPVSREFELESGLLETASTTKEPPRNQHHSTNPPAAHFSANPSSNPKGLFLRFGDIDCRKIFRLGCELSGVDSVALDPAPF